MEEWLPEKAVRRSSPPSDVWMYLQIYGIWIAAALLLYAAMVSKTRVIGVPACILAAAGIAWYFAWSGRKIADAKWRVLLPLCGYLVAVTLLLRAFTLWDVR